MEDQVLVFVLLAVGFILLGVELLLPTGGIVGVMCTVSFLASAYFAYQAWAETNPLYWRIYIFAFLAMIPTTIAGIYYLLTQTRFGNRVLLAAPSTEEVTPYQAEQSHLEMLIGQRGRAVSPLKPGGLVQVDGERLHATGQGFIIESGAIVEVIGVQGTRAIVRPVDTTNEPATQDIERTDATASELASNEQTPSASEVVDPFKDADPT